eukprot:GFUD01043402.1.p1 GENE.GFUD01043402.1~~GFUD01043402.1.p1  ORF type:complete len:648 (-),score=155.03 GFUD01043402.1:902-2845(-)
MASGAGCRVIPTPVVATPTPTTNPLGPNSNFINRGPDSAVLRPSIKTSVTGVRQAITALESGTREVRSYLLNEVNIIYECKVCLNMFRSLANLTAHKRSYCIEHFEDVNHIFSSKKSSEAAQLQTVVIEAEPVETVIPEPSWDIENYAPSLDLLKDAGIISAIEEKPIINRLLPPRKANLTAVVDKLASKLDSEFYKTAEQKVATEKKLTKTDGICLEPMSQSSNAQFQSWTSGFEYKEVQTLKQPVIVAIAPTGKELPKGDMNGAIDRSKSPTTSEGSKENIEEEFEKNTSIDDNGNTVRYPCPECKKGFAKVSNVYKHLATNHGKSKEEYTKMRKEIQDNAYIVEKADVKSRGPHSNPEKLINNDEPAPQYQFKKSKSEKALQLALAIGLVNRNGVGMQKINKQVEKIEKEEKVADVKADGRGRGRPPKKTTLDEMQARFEEEEKLEQNESNGQNGMGEFEDSDSEVSFNPESISPEAEEHMPNKKRKRIELVTKETPKAESTWRGGEFNCILCEKSFKTPTFLLQHYVSPHFKNELKNEFTDALVKKKCPTCKAGFDTETKLLMHLGATHREVQKYLPEHARNFKPVMRSPAKSKTPLRGPTPDPSQKLFANLAKGPMKSPEKKSPPKNSIATELPQLADEFMS